LYERSILILDSPGCALGDFSLGLLSLGMHPHHSFDLDELILLAGEHRARVGALAVDGAQLCGELERIRKELLEPNGLTLACAVPVGPALSAEERRRLSLAGVQWAAFDPITPRELRFVLALALASTDSRESRASARVPVELPVQVSTGERTFRATLHDLSFGGAYVAARSPLKQGTRLGLDFELDGVRIQASAEVRWRTALDGGFAGWLDPGMGVCFGAFTPEAEAALVRFIATAERRFLLTAARES